MLYVALHCRYGIVNVVTKKAGARSGAFWHSKNCRRHFEAKINVGVNLSVNMRNSFIIPSFLSTNQETDQEEHLQNNTFFVSSGSSNLNQSVSYNSKLINTYMNDKVHNLICIIKYSWTV